eukprot:3042744-Pleurochrysis_carterae.AAC.5
MLQGPSSRKHGGTFNTARIAVSALALFAWILFKKTSCTLSTATGGIEQDLIKSFTSVTFCSFQLLLYPTWALQTFLGSKPLTQSVISRYPSLPSDIAIETEI